MGMEMISMFEEGVWWWAWELGGGGSRKWELGKYIRCVVGFLGRVRRCLA